jgi:molybdopterin converting factor small subunit
VKLRVVPFAPYRDGLGSEPFELDLADGSTLRDLLRALAGRAAQFEPLARARGDEWLWGQLLVHSDGELVRLDDRLRDGECLELLPPIAGG